LIGLRTARIISVINCRAAGLQCAGHSAASVILKASKQRIGIHQVTGAREATGTSTIQIVAL
jgi:hypothetical protein